MSVRILCSCISFNVFGSANRNISVPIFPILSIFTTNFPCEMNEFLLNSGNIKKKYFKSGDGW